VLGGGVRQFWQEKKVAPLAGVLLGGTGALTFGAFGGLCLPLGPFVPLGLWVAFGCLWGLSVLWDAFGTFEGLCWPLCAFVCLLCLCGPLCAFVCLCWPLLTLRGLCVPFWCLCVPLVSLVPLGAFMGLCGPLAPL